MAIESNFLYSCSVSTFSKTVLAFSKQAMRFHGVRELIFEDSFNVFGYGTSYRDLMVVVRVSFSCPLIEKLG